MSSAAIHQVGWFDTTELKARNLLELVVAYTLILLTLWTAGATQRVLMLFFFLSLPHPYVGTDSRTVRL